MEFRLEEEELEILKDMFTVYEEVGLDDFDREEIQVFKTLKARMLMLGRSSSMDVDEVDDDPDFDVDGNYIDY